MPKEKKYILNVIFGENASEIADERGFRKTRNKISKLELEGAYATYEFDTKRDREVAMSILNDNDGWMGVYYECPELPCAEKKGNDGEDQTTGPKCQ